MAQAKKLFVDSVTSLLRDQFEAHQHQRIDEDDSTGTGKASKSGSHTNNSGMVAALSRAVRIKKELHVLQLNQGLAGLSVEGANEGNSDDAGFESIVSQLLVDYLIACMANVASESNSSSSAEMVADEHVCVNSEVRASVVDLVMALAVLLGETPLLALVSCLVEASTVLSDKLRGMACEAMGNLAVALVEWNKRGRKKRKNTSLETQQLVLVELTEAIEPRLKDKSTSVRGNATVAAASVLRLTGSRNGRITSKIQEDHDDQESDDSALLEAWLWNLWHDPSVSNRVLAVETIPISSESSSSRRAVLVDHLISRLRDVKEKVRVAAVQALHTKVVSLADLSSIQMAEIVKSGLSARCHATKEAASKLICSNWMKLAKFNALNLLKSIDVQTNEDEAEQMVRVILEAIANDSGSTSSNSKSSLSWLDDLSAPEIRAFKNSITNYLVSLDSLADANPDKSGSELISAEQVFLARVACTGGGIHNGESGAKDYGHGDIAMLQTVVPDISVLCSMFQDHSYKMIEAMEKNRNTENSASSDDGECLVEYHCFVCLQLLPLATAAGLAEEGSRRRLTSMLQAILSSPATPDDLVEGAVQALSTACHFDASGRDAVQAIKGILDNLQEQKQAALSEQGDDEDSGIAGLCALRILSIISIFLELASPSLAVRDLLQNVSDRVVGAITNISNNAHEGLIREAGVCCLGKMGLYSDESLVLRVYKPLLLRIAGGIDRDNERLEIRSQALMALSDWAMVFPEILQPTPAGATMTPLVFMDILVQDFLQAENPSTACIAAEIAVKLLFAGRICESGLISRLLVFFFDPRYQVAAKDISSDSDQDSATEIGSCIRVQQLLSLFFPAFCWQSKHARDAVLGSIESALSEAISQKSPSTKGKRAKTRTAAFPLVKMVEYICSIVTVSEELQEDQKKNEGVAQKIDSGEEDYKIAIVVAVQLAQFVLSALLRSEQVGAKSMNLTQCRGLCKLLGSLEVSSEEGTVSSEYSSHIRKLQDNMEELGMILTDGTALRSLSPLTQELSEVEIIQDEEVFPHVTSATAGRSSPTMEGRQSNASALTEAISTGSGETTLDDSLMMAGKENDAVNSRRSSRNRKDVEYLEAGSALRSSNRLRSVSNY